MMDWLLMMDLFFTDLMMDDCWEGLLGSIGCLGCDEILLVLMLMLLLLGLMLLLLLLMMLCCWELLLIRLGFCYSLEDWDIFED